MPDIPPVGNLVGQEIIESDISKYVRAPLGRVYNDPMREYSITDAYSQHYWYKQEDVEDTFISWLERYKWEFGVTTETYSMDSDLLGKCYQFYSIPGVPLERDHTPGFYRALHSILAKNKPFKEAYSEYISSGNTENILNSISPSGNSYYWYGNILYPHAGAEVGPAAFGASGVDKYWTIVYTGFVQPKESGRYRFVGKFDDVLWVRIKQKDQNNNLVWKGVFDGSFCWQYKGGWDFNDELAGNAKYTHLFSNWTPKVNAKHTLNGIVLPEADYMVYGDWIDLSSTDATEIEIGVGEVPGGWIGGVLLIEQEGKSYGKQGNRPILPLFTTSLLDSGAEQKIDDIQDTYGFKIAKTNTPIMNYTISQQRLEPWARLVPDGYVGEAESLRGLFDKFTQNRQDIDAILSDMSEFKLYSTAVDKNTDTEPTSPEECPEEFPEKTYPNINDAITAVFKENAPWYSTHDLEADLSKIKGKDVLQYIIDKCNSLTNFRKTILTFKCADDDSDNISETNRYGIGVVNEAQMHTSKYPNNEKEFKIRFLLDEADDKTKTLSVKDYEYVEVNNEWIWRERPQLKFISTNFNNVLNEINTLLRGHFKKSDGTFTTNHTIDYNDVVQFVAKMKILLKEICYNRICRFLFPEDGNFPPVRTITLVYHDYWAPNTRAAEVTVRTRTGKNIKLPGSEILVTDRCKRAFHNAWVIGKDEPWPKEYNKRKNVPAWRWDYGNPVKYPPAIPSNYSYRAGTMSDLLEEGTYGYVVGNWTKLGSSESSVINNHSPVLNVNPDNKTQLLKNSSGNTNNTVVHLWPVCLPYVNITYVLDENTSNVLSARNVDPGDSSALSNYKRNSVENFFKENGKYVEQIIFGDSYTFPAENIVKGNFPNWEPSGNQTSRPEANAPTDGWYLYKRNTAIIDSHGKIQSNIGEFSIDYTVNGSKKQPNSTINSLLEDMTVIIGHSYSTVTLLCTPPNAEQKWRSTDTFEKIEVDDGKWEEWKGAPLIGTMGSRYRTGTISLEFNLNGNGVEVPNNLDFSQVLEFSFKVTGFINEQNGTHFPCNIFFSSISCSKTNKYLKGWISNSYGNNVDESNYITFKDLDANDNHKWFWYARSGGIWSAYRPQDPGGAVRSWGTLRNNGAYHSVKIDVNAKSNGQRRLDGKKIILKFRLYEDTEAKDGKKTKNDGKTYNKGAYGTIYIGDVIVKWKPS